MVKSHKDIIGSWAFLIGVVLAVVFGVIGSITPAILWLLVAIGVIVGLLNVTDEEATPFLMSGAVLVIVSSIGKDTVSTIPILSQILNALMSIFVPATIIVALKNVFSLARR